MSNDMSVVYFIECVGRIKIGYSTDVKGRMSALATGAPQRLTLIATIPGSPQFERAIHRHLASHRTNGEWFADCATVRDAIADLIARGPAAIGFLDEGRPPPGRAASPVQVAITNLIKTKRPPGTKAWELVSDSFGLKERAAKNRLANASSYTIEEVQALCRGDDGHEFVKALMANANPKWWGPYKRAIKKWQIRQIVESQRSA